MAGKITEISFEVEASECEVIDAYCQANSKKRTHIMRALLREWSDKKRHEAIMICRVAGIKPGDPGPDRDRSVASEFGGITP